MTQVTASKLIELLQRCDSQARIHLALGSTDHQGNLKIPPLKSIEYCSTSNAILLYHKRTSEADDHKISAGRAIDFLQTRVSDAGVWMCNGTKRKQIVFVESCVASGIVCLWTVIPDFTDPNYHNDIDILSKDAFFAETIYYDIEGKSL